MVSFAGQLITQIQCYFRKIKPVLPAEIRPQDQALIRDAASEQNAINHLNEKGIACSLNDAANLLETVIPQLKDPKLRTLCTEMMTKVKAVGAKFASGNGNFNDIFTLNTKIRDTLKENFGGGCGESTLPEGESSSGKFDFSEIIVFFLVFFSIHRENIILICR